jgi:drug/metabolite transporter (DMT)-like permease
MTASHQKLGLLLGFIGMCLFAGTLPATQLALSRFDPLFLTVARAALAGSAGLVVLIVMRRRIPPRSLWVISGHFALREPCPLYPRKRTLVGAFDMTANGPHPPCYSRFAGRFVGTANSIA